MKTLVITANLGNFDKQIDPVSQSVPFDFYRFTDQNFPPRSKAMMPRLQSRIVKMFGWQMVPGYDIYIWVDSSCALLHPNSVSWLLEKLGNKDLALLKHPNRKSIQEEADYLRKRLVNDNRYIIPRYQNELLEEQMAEIMSEKYFEDTRLFASTVMVYRNNNQVHGLMKEWWYHTSRYHQIDQLSLPYVLFKSGCSFNVIEENYMKTEFITYVRK